MGITTEVVALVGATFTFISTMVKMGLDFYIERRKLNQQDKEIEKQKQKISEIKKQIRQLKKVKVNGQKNVEPDYDDSSYSNY